MSSCSARSSRPTANDPDRVVALAELTEAAGLDLVTFQDHPYNPSPPRHLDPAELGRRPHRAATRLGERAQPPATPAGRAGPGRGEPGPALATAGSNSASAPARSGTRSRAWAVRRLTPGRERRGAERRRSTSCAASGTTSTRGPLRLRRRAPPGARHAARPDAGTRHRHLARRVQAADAGADRQQGRRLAAHAGVPASRRTGSTANRPHRRGGDGGGARPAGDPAAAQPLPGRLLRRAPTGSCRGTRRAVGRPAASARPRGGVQRLPHRPATTRASSRPSAQEVAPALREAVARGTRTDGDEAGTGPVRSTAALARRAPGIDYDALPASLAARPSSPATRSTSGSATATAGRARRRW